jgi:hypothetical protein
MCAEKPEQKPAFRGFIAILPTCEKCHLVNFCSVLCLKSMLFEGKKWKK